MKPCHSDWQKLVFFEKLFCFREIVRLYRSFIILGPISLAKLHQKMFQKPTISISCKPFIDPVLTLNIHWLPTQKLQKLTTTLQQRII